jgi:hypothetical protein
MNPIAFDYLLRLAALSITFVGFSTIVVTLRRTLGADLSPYHLLLVRYYIQNGLSVAIASLLPSLLNLFGLPSPVIWRVSSAAVGIVSPVFLFAYLRRRRRIQPGPAPIRSYIRYSISIIIIVGLWLNVTGVFFESNGAPYALAMTWFLFSAGIVFLQTLDEVLYRTPTA